MAPYADTIAGSARIRAQLEMAKAARLLADAAFRIDPVAAGALDPSWMPLIKRLEQDGLDPDTLRRTFARLGPDSFTPAFMGWKITELHRVGGIGIRRTLHTTPETPLFYEQPVPDVTVGSCLAFMKQYAGTLGDIQKTYGVDAETILGVMLMETALGTNLGNDVALRAIGGMAATDCPEKLGLMGNKGQVSRVNSRKLSATLRDKSEWAYKEVKALLEHAETTGLDASRLPGSIYGAIGICQFMPSNIERFGVDGDGDGVINLFSVVDAMYSIASYLHANGWRPSASENTKHRVIMTYNQDTFYASGVLATAKRLAQGGKGKVSPKAIAVAGGGRVVPSARLDPSLRRLRPPPPRARVQSLGDYQRLLQ